MQHLQSRRKGESSCFKCVSQGHWHAKCIFSAANAVISAAPTSIEEFCNSPNHEVAQTIFEIVVQLKKKTNAKTTTMMKAFLRHWSWKVWITLFLKQVSRLMITKCLKIWPWTESSRRWRAEKSLLQPSMHTARNKNTEHHLLKPGIFFLPNLANELNNSDKNTMQIFFCSFWYWSTTYCGWNLPSASLWKACKPIIRIVTDQFRRPFWGEIYS